MKLWETLAKFEVKLMDKYEEIIIKYFIEIQKININ